jgi:hypothetical protein
MYSSPEDAAHSSALGILQLVAIDLDRLARGQLCICMI